MINKVEIEDVVIPSSDIKAGGFNIMYNADGDDPILIGAVVGGNLKFSIYNRGDYHINKYRGKEVYVYINNQRTGPYTIEEVMFSNGKKVIEIEAYDKVRSMNRSFANSEVLFPNKIGFILREILRELDIKIKDEDLEFLNSGIVVDLDEDEKANYSYRDIIESIVQLSAGMGYIDPTTGTFKIKSILRRLSYPIEVLDSSIKSESLSEDRRKTGVVYYKDINEIYLYDSIDDPIIVKKNPFINQLPDPEDFITYIGDLYKDKGHYNLGRIDIFEIKDSRNLLSKDRTDGYFVGDTITDGEFRFIITSLSYTPGGVIYLNSEGGSVVDIEMSKVKELKRNYK